MLKIIMYTKKQKKSSEGVFFEIFSKLICLLPFSRFISIYQQYISKPNPVSSNCLSPSVLPTFS